MDYFDLDFGFSTENIYGPKKDTVNFDGDFDAASLEVLDSENSLEYFELFANLQEQNADEKIRMLRKMNASMLSCHSSENYKSIEKFIDEQSLETAAQSEANGGKHEATGDNIDKDKLGKEKDGFFKSLWAKIVKFFKDCMGYVRKAINWIRKTISNLFKRNPELSKDIPQEKKEEINKKLETYVVPEEDLSTDGTICFKTNVADALLGNTIKYVKICQDAKNLALGIQKNSTSFDGNTLNGPISDILNIVKEMKIPNADKLPQMHSSSKEDVKKFNAALKATISDISYDKHPEHYAKAICGADYIKKTKGITLEELFGNHNDFDSIKAILSKTDEILGNVDSNIVTAERNIDEMDKAFTQYLNSNGNRSRLTGDIKSDGSGDDERYAIIGAVTATFKVIQTLSTVFSKLSAKIAKSVVIANKALKKATEADAKDRAEKAKADKAKSDDEYFKRMEKDNARQDEEEQRKKNLQRLDDATKYQEAIDADAKARADKEKADKRAAAKAKREANNTADEPKNDDVLSRVREDNARRDEEEQRKRNLQKVEDAKRYQDAIDADAKARADKEKADKRAAAKRKANSKANMEKKLASKPELEAKKRYYNSSSEDWDMFLDLD